MLLLCDFVSLSLKPLYPSFHLDIFHSFFFFFIFSLNISEDNMDLFREMGGVVFVYNLSKSSVVHSDVKETALFTLGTLAESNCVCVCVLNMSATPDS